MSFLGSGKLETEVLYHEARNNQLVESKVPLSSWDQAIQIIKDCIASGVYKLSTVAYRSHWFCVLKQDVYGMMDLFTGYDQRLLRIESRDMTTFNSPLGLHCLTTLLMGHTNAIQVYQVDMSFILQDEIPDYTKPFINDVPVKTETTQYQRLDGSYETIPKNPSIRLFIWKHLTIVNRIL
ncbi:hypothetical protein HD554DRAFT_2172459 [Boletus coccyginus]|nr:hypothetical protein HD554DRAFT_2172459 [Boletus coccyginus]